MSGKSIKLVYFDLRGRGEYIRLVLEAAGQQYEDVRIPFNDWPKIKSTTPTGLLPYMEYNGKLYGQSHAIAAFFAKEFGFYGKTTLDELRIAEVVGQWSDQLEAIVSYRWAKDEDEKAEFLKKILEEQLPMFFGFFEKTLADSGYFVNDSLSLADMYVFDMQDNLLQLKADALEKYPKMQKMRENVMNHPKLKVYLQNRKQTIF